jgi:predicted alpha/beta-fold hydrolase
MDQFEPMQYVYVKYCKNRKVFAIGTSMGGAILGNLIGYQGKDCFLDAGFLVHPPLKMWENTEHIRDYLGGWLNKGLGRSLNKVIL